MGEDHGASGLQGVGGRAEGLRRVGGPGPAWGSCPPGHSLLPELSRSCWKCFQAGRQCVRSLFIAHAAREGRGAARGSVPPPANPHLLQVPLHMSVRAATLPRALGTRAGRSVWGASCLNAQWAARCAAGFPGQMGTDMQTGLTGGPGGPGGPFGPRRPRGPWKWKEQDSDAAGVRPPAWPRQTLLPPPAPAPPPHRSPPLHLGSLGLMGRSDGRSRGALSERGAFRSDGCPFTLSQVVSPKPLHMTQSHLHGARGSPSRFQPPPPSLHAALTAEPAGPGGQRQEKPGL